MSEDFLSEELRAEDIILGSLGFGEDAHIISIRAVDGGFVGIGRWADGEEFDFESDSELSELEMWALGVLLNFKGRYQAA